MVTPSAYSSSPPTASPEAMRVTRTPSGLQHLGQVERGRLALDVRAGGDDHLSIATVARPRRAQQLADAQIVGADAVERREHAVQHVVAAAKAAGALDREQIGRRGDHADEARVAARVAAQRARILLGEVHAHRAEADLLLDLDERLRQLARVARRARAARGRRAAWRSSRRCRAAWPARGSAARSDRRRRRPTR